MYLIPCDDGVYLLLTLELLTKKLEKAPFSFMYQPLFILFLTISHFNLHLAYYFSNKYQANTDVWRVFQIFFSVKTLW